LCRYGAEDLLWERIEKQEEGLVIKDLGSKWMPGERGNNWVKLKPDYLPTEDLDCVIIGGFYGTAGLYKLAMQLTRSSKAPGLVSTLEPIK
jgi:ATP-dependent DNA ligase